MELYEVSGTAEKRLQRKADQEYIPLGGTMELLPLCNMNCKMCYVRQTEAEMNAQGNMLSSEQWLDIARQGVEQGMLFALLTGGEPLLYPEFKKLYTGLSDMGLIIRVNTNGTLINEEWADFFAQHNVRTLSITLYGKDDATYKDLCGNPKGFTQVMNAAKLLKERNVPFRFTCSATTYNVNQLKEIYQIAEEFDAPMLVATYMFPPTRRNREVNASRMDPVTAAHATIESWKLGNKTENILLPAKLHLARMKLEPRLKGLKGFKCHAGHSGYWINWKGEMSPCGMFGEPKISLLNHSFAQCWEYIVKKCMDLHQCNECKSCGMQNVCTVCPANCYTETGKTDGKPEYLCQMTSAIIHELENIIEKIETAEGDGQHGTLSCGKQL